MRNIHLWAISSREMPIFIRCNGTHTLLIDEYVFNIYWRTLEYAIQHKYPWHNLESIDVIKRGHFYIHILLLLNFSSVALWAQQPRHCYKGNLVILPVEKDDKAYSPVPLSYHIGHCRIAYFSILLKHFNTICEEQDASLQVAWGFHQKPFPNC